MFLKTPCVLLIIFNFVKKNVFNGTKRIVVLMQMLGNIKNDIR